MPSNPQVPDGWRMARLGEVLRLEYGVSLPKRDRMPGNVRVYGSAGEIGRHSNAVVEGPGLVVGRKGSIGSVTWAPEDFVPIDTTYFGLPIMGAADLRWLFHLLGHEDLSSLNRATGVPGLNRDDVYALKRPIPPLEEQREIAAVLDSIDEAIERTDEVIAATERLRDALLHDLLTRGLPGRHTEWKQVRGLGTIPACWDVVRLGDVAIVQTGRAVNRSKDAGPLEVPYLSVANVKDGYLDLEHVKTMQVSPDALTRYGLRSDDVLFTEGGDADKLGRGTVWRGELAPCLHQNHVFAVRPRDQALLSEFLSACAESHRGKRYFLGAARQTTNLASMNSSQLKNMPLPLPTREEQEALAMALACAADFLGKSRREIAHLNELKAGAAETLLAGCTSVNASRKGTPQ